MEILSLKEFLTEAFASQQLQKVADIIIKYLYKKTGIKWFKMPGIEQFSNSYIKNASGLRFFSSNAKSVRFNFISRRINSSQLHSMDIWNGTTQHPNYNITFPKNTSLVKIIPSVVGIIMHPHIGEIDIIPSNKNLNINEELEIDDEIFLTESKEVRYISAFDDIIKILNNNEPFDVKTILPKPINAHYSLYTFILKNYPSFFQKQGHKNIFVGSKEQILKDKEKIINGAGGFIAEVRIGASNETYNVSGIDEEPEEKVTFKEQLSHLKDLVKLILKGASNSLIISGIGGIGKTYTVEKVLSQAGMEDGEGYFKNTGSVSPIGLYTLLYKYRDGILLFDDCDAVWADQEARNLLKAATDTKKIRKLVWNKKSSLLVDPEDIEEGDDESIPKYFFFTGKIIFISNLQISKLDPDGAMRTRSLVLNVNPSDKELLDYMEEKIDDYELEDGLFLSHKERLEVFNVVKTSKNKNALSLRRLVRALNIRAASEDIEGWEKLVKLYA